MIVTEIKLGDLITKIYTYTECLGCDGTIIGDETCTEKPGDFECYIQPNEDRRCFCSNKKYYEGITKDIFITCIPLYNLLAITHLNGNKIFIKVDKGSVTKKTYYIIRSLIRKHIIRLIFRKNYVVFHASSLYIPNCNKGVLIIGRSGSGKSSFLWYMLNNTNATMCSDDVNVVSMDTDLISGNGENIFVGPDFFKFNKVLKMEFVEVSPGRKIEIILPDAKKQVYKFKPNFIYILKPDHNEKIDELSEADAVSEIENCHKFWLYDDYEYNKMAMYTRYLCSNAKATVTFGLNDNNLYKIKQLLSN